VTEPAPPRSPLAALGACLGLLSRRQRWGWAALVPLSLLSAAAEAAGAAAVFLLIRVLSDPGTPPPLPGVLRGPWERLAGDAPVVPVTVFVVLVYLAKNLFIALTIDLQSRVVYRTRASLARRLYDGYLGASYRFHLRRDSAALIHRLTENLDKVVHQTLAGAVAALTEILVVAGVLAVLIAASPGVTLAIVAILGAVLAAALVLLQRRLFVLGEREIALKQRILKAVQQTLDGIKEIRVMGREGFFRRRFAARQEELARVGRRRQLLELVPRLLFESSFIVATLLVVVLLAARGEQASREVVPLLGLYAYAGFRVIPSFNRILMHLNNLWFASPAVEELTAGLGRLAADPGEPAPAAATGELVFRRRLVLERVSYAYEERRAVLDGVSFTIPQGAAVGLVGATGAGKSTLVDLLLGLLAPTAGRILVDGADLRAHLAAWRRKVGYVPQRIFLADDTLRRNVAFGLPEAEIDRRRLEAAARLAGLERLVAELPRGLDTVVGERGARLSGGQRQLLAIARALYHDPEMLIFDEATSSLDGRTERVLAGVLEALRGRKTLLLVAHRPSTIRSCDEVVLLQDGRVAARGTWRELAERHPAFRKLMGWE